MSTQSLSNEIELELAERNLNAVAILLFVKMEESNTFTQAELSQLLGMTATETLDALYDLQSIGRAQFIVARQEWQIFVYRKRRTGGYKELNFNKVGLASDLEFAYLLDNALVH